MSIIKVMDINLSNKIAAGEVVEKIMNVVKELVENSIDAKAKNIKVTLIDSGTRSVEVTDDGIGMDYNDATNCLKRHASSKIYSDDDLFNIKTLGFRGEALPSIAAVSKMMIKTSDGITGTTVLIEDGEIKDIVKSDLRQGTLIKVENLFYNTPARLKYLRNLYIELSNTVEYLNKMALSCPNISFTLINNDKVLLKTDGSNNLLKVINSIYGMSVTKKMINIKNNNDDYLIEGYISYPEIARTARNNITTLVNGRLIKNNELNKTIIESYHTYIPKDKFPIVVLNITCDFSLVDVNVHPTKMDVKFSKIDYLKNLVSKTITNSLQKLILIPDVIKEDINDITNIHVIDSNVSYNDNNSNEESKNYEKITFDFTVNEEKEYIKEKFKMIEPLALIHGTYIVGENEDGMYLIDQHAANERISYEFYLKSMGEDNMLTTDLLVPIQIELSNRDYLILKENFSILDIVHIGYEEFGDNTLIIRSHPCWLKKGYEEEQIRKIIEIIISKEEFSKEKYQERVAINLACKTSIKANEHISIEEMYKLIEKLRNTNNPFTCPHGRPTIISYSNYELEKLFKRAMN